MSVTRRTVLGLSAALWVPACGDDDPGGATASPDGGDLDAAPGTTDGGVAPSAEAASETTAPFVSGPEPSPPWAAPGAEDTAAFAWGVQTGDVTSTSVLIGVRTTESALDLTVVRGTTAGWVDETKRTDLTPDAGVIRLELGDLAPDTTYALAFYSKDGTRRSRVARFRTAPPLGFARVIRFGATSCLALDGAPFSNLTQCAADGPLDFFCLLGDTVYADGQDDFEGLWKGALAQQGLRDITAATSVIGIWDDHEVHDNWSWTTEGIQARHDAALLAFNRSIPHRDGPAGSKLYRKLAWGDALDVFVLDCRDERRNGQYISDLQMDWLKAGLEASTARFKIILNSVPIIDFSQTVIGTIQASDRWQGYQQRAEILEHIEVRNIQGVLWLSGDFHFGLISRVDPPGKLASEQWEVMCGPGGSSINIAVQGISPGAQITDVIKELNSVLFEADPEKGTVKVRFVGNAGQLLAARTLQL